MYELIFKKVAREEDFFFFFNFMFLWLKSHLSVHPYVRPFMHPPFSLCDLGLCSGRDKAVELSGNWSGGAHIIGYLLLPWCFSVFSFRTFQQMF